MKEKQVINTKKYVTFFVVCCFLIIGGIGGYQSLNHSEKPNQEVLQEEDSSSEVESNKDKSDNEDTPSKEENPTISKEETEKEPPKQEEKPKKEETPPKEESSSKQETVPEVDNTPDVPETPDTTPPPEDTTLSKPEVVMYHVSITIKGINETLGKGNVSVEQGASCYDVLASYASSTSIPVITSGGGTSVYVKGIAGLKEFDYGGRSGWTYTINGNFINRGCGGYIVEDGDVIEWVYTGYE